MSLVLNTRKMALLICGTAQTDRFMETHTQVVDTEQTVNHAIKMATQEVTELM